ncbi:MAG: uridine kinase [Gaiellaceae bacterium]
MAPRHLVMEELGDALAAVDPGRLMRVGIDGVDGAGKTLLAEDVAQLLTTRGRPAVRVSIDQFERTMEERYVRGELSPEGYYLDAFDFLRFREHVLSVRAPGHAVLVCDGVFLHRPELADLWDASIFVEVDLEVAARRGAERNLGVWDDSLDATHERYRVRYMPAQRRYIEAQRPHEQATFVLRNTQLDDPELITPRR